MSQRSTEFRIDLTASPEAAGVARRFVRAHSDSLPADSLNDAQLLVSELVTNAVRHGRPAISLVLNLDPPLIGVAVHDEGDLLPPVAPVSPGTDQPGGRGLMIVDRLSSTWGVLPDDQPPGKTVWFRIDPA